MSALIFPDQETWLAARQTRIGGSEVAALFGCEAAHQQFHYALWQVKSSRIPAPDVTSWLSLLPTRPIRTVTAGGDPYEVEREQWDDGNNVVALEPGVVVAYDRNVYTTPSCARPVSRSSPSLAPSSAVDAAVVIA